MAIFKHIEHGFEIIFRITPTGELDIAVAKIGGVHRGEQGLAFQLNRADVETLVNGLSKVLEGG